MNLFPFEILDTVRRMQGVAYGVLGFGPHELAYRVIASTRYWRLREYSGGPSAPTLFIVAAPIKRPYIWDLAPRRSAVSYCLKHGLRVCLLEWIPPHGDAGDIGLEAYAGQAISSAMDAASQAGGMKPFLAGHSLGGTLAAIHAALDPQCTSGLILLSAPLCFGKGTSPFRDALVSIAPPQPSGFPVIPGSVLSHISALVAPGTFIWSRLLDAALSLGDYEMRDMHGRIERWALDEVALSGRLMDEILQWLYREDRFCRGVLSLGERVLSPSSIEAPILALVNSADEIVPRNAVQPFLNAVRGSDVRLIEFPGEIGVALQHVGILAGRAAYVHVWPKIITWIKERVGDSRQAITSI